MDAGEAGAAADVSTLTNSPGVEGLRRHGGRLGEAAARWPKAPRPWIDLSTGVNPWPYPAARATRSARARLPDPFQLLRLEAEAAAAFGAPAERVCATAGGEGALRLLPLLIKSEVVTVVSPTYASHSEAWSLAGARLRQVCVAEALGPADEVGGVWVLVNPNNPDGAVVAARDVLALADRLQSAGGWLVVDESFAEVAPACSVAARAGGRLVVLRSFGKFYGLAGLRLGFVLGEPALLAQLRVRQGDWPVSADALAAGLAAYADTAWAVRMRRRLAREMQRLDAALRGAGYELVGGTDLFRLVRAADAAQRFEALGRRGVLVRPFATAPDQLRFGLPPQWAWRRLQAALSEGGR